MPKGPIVSARVPPVLKDAAEAIFAQLGITPSRAVTLFYQRTVDCQGLPWEQPVVEVEGAVLNVEGDRPGTWVAPTSPMPSKSLV